MKQVHLKSKNKHKSIKYAFILLMLISSAAFTFNYLNKNIYEYNTKEYLDLFTKLTFSFENSIDMIVNKLFDFYDNVTNTEVVKRWKNFS